MPIIYDERGMIKRPGLKIEFDRAMMSNYAQCAQSVVYFAQHFFYIIHPKTGSQLIKLRDYQERILKAFQDNRFNILLSARQMGKTTCSAIYLLWYAIFNKEKTIAILANKADTAKGILAEIKYAYERLPSYLKPGVLEYNAFSIEFENKCKVFAKATSPDALRGESVSLLFLDEFAFVPQNFAEAFWSSNYPTLSTGGACIVVSTPNGTANLFYTLWKNSIDGENDFHHEMVRWDEDPTRDEKWKETTIRNIGQIEFNKEYGCAFVGSSITLIDSNHIVNHLKSVPPMARPDDYTKIWKFPEATRKYLVVIDTSGGVGSDFSVMNIFDITDYPKKPAEQVALWARNDVTPPKFADIVYDTLVDWNNAYVIGETNGLSNEVLSRLFNDREYERIYYDYDDETYGIFSDKASKPKACMWFKEELEGHRIKLYDQKTIDELSYFEEVSPGVYKARVGKTFHDDHAITGVWAAFFLKSKYFEDEQDEWKLENRQRRSNDDEAFIPDNEEDGTSESEQMDAIEAWEGFLEADNERNGDDWLERDEIRRYRGGQS